MRIVLATEEREYVAKLAEYLREQEKGWEVAAYTHGSALSREMKSGGKVDVLVGDRGMIGQALASSGGTAKILVLEDSAAAVGRGEAGEEAWLAIPRYQPLPALLSCIRGALGNREAKRSEGCQVWTMFSASGGAGKTTAALNLVRQAGERGLRVLYLNLEELNATSLLFGRGEPDALSRLLYALQARPEQWEELSRRLCRNQPHLRADYIDAPDHPGERLALSPESAAALIGKLRTGNRYDVIVVDPDSGAGDWHAGLLGLSDRVVWLTLDDAQCLLKTEKLLRYWDSRPEGLAFKLTFAMNKAVGGQLVNRWTLPGDSPAVALPYIPQWKAIDQPGRWLSSPAYSGAAEKLLDVLTGSTDGRGRRDEGHGGQRTRDRGTG